MISCNECDNKFEENELIWQLFPTKIYPNGFIFKEHHSYVCKDCLPRILEILDNDRTSSNNNEITRESSK